MKNPTFVLLIVATAVIAAGSLPTAAQISPGELAEPHAFLEGMKNCTKCHDLGKGPSTKKCLDCHKEIADGVRNERGYHHRTVNVDKMECFDCHSEHAGRDFRLVHWPDGIDGFEHELTGYNLEGKHSTLKCRNCHKSDLIRTDLSQFGDQVDASRTFLGLGTTCLDCHLNEHRGQLAEDCLNCHTNDKWKPSKTIDHARTAYPLDGKHLTLACAACHPTVEERDEAWPGSESFVRYKGISHTNCTPCHKDPHQGSYGALCATCHNTTLWRDVPEGKFDHTKTRYPLLGRHAGLTCVKCHEPNTKKAPLAHERCVDCHKDRHRGQFAQRPDGGACESCHTVSGFTPSLFAAVDHSKTRFTLEGSHLAQPCIACHREERAADGSAYRLYTVEHSSCTSCHKDIHLGQFGEKTCTGCHNVREWREVTFDHDRDSRYKLEGEHRRVKCGGCHVQVTENSNTFIRYKPINPACKTCHSRTDLELGRN